MVTIRNERIVIEIGHECPDKFIYDLKEALVAIMLERDFDFVNPEFLNETNCVILELLKNLMLTSHEN